jgi:hypothetical protein
VARRRDTDRTRDPPKHVTFQSVTGSRFRSFLRGGSGMSGGRWRSESVVEGVTLLLVLFSTPARTAFSCLGFIRRHCTLGSTKSNTRRLPWESVLGSHTAKKRWSGLPAWGHSPSASSGHPLPSPLKEIQSPYIDKGERAAFDYVEPS